MVRKLITMKNEKKDSVWPRIWQEILKSEKWEAHTVGPGIWQENWKISKMKNTLCRTWNMAINTQKREKREKHTVGPGFWREN